MYIYFIIIFIYSIISKDLKENNNNINLSLITKKQIKNWINKNNNFFLLETKNYTNNIFLSNSDENNEKEKNKIEKVELIFRKYYICSFIILLLGIITILYGGYYYKFGIIIHSTIFLFYFISLIIPSIDEKYYQLVLFFSFISGIVIYYNIGNDEISSFKLKILKSINGGILGFFIHKIIYYYIIISYSDKNIIYNYIYYITCIALIFIFGGLNLFFPDKFSFLPCSIISSSFYIINTLDSIIVNENEFNKKEKIITSMIIQFLFIVCSLIYQIFHIKNKINENPFNYKTPKFEENEYYSRDSYVSQSQLSETIQDLETINNSEIKEELFNTKNKDGDEYEEDEINDQED